MTAPLEVGLCCTDLDRLSRFYVDVLRCRRISLIEVAAERAHQAGLSDQGYRVARLQTPWGERIKLLEPVKAPSCAPRPSWILERQNAAYLTFIVRDLAVMLSRLKTSGADVMSGDAPVEVRPGVWLVFAADPEGNILEFVQYHDVEEYRPDLATVHNASAGAPPPAPALQAAEEPRRHP